MIINAKASSEQSRHRISQLLVATVLLTLFSLLLYTNPALAQEQRRPGRNQTAETFAPGGALSCLGCHNQAPANTVLQTPHASRADARTPFADHDCESCHGPSSEHRRSERLPVSIQFDGGAGAFPSADLAIQNQVCLGCHENGARTHWASSSHQFADLACVSCHDIHAARDAVLQTSTQPAVCFTCHQDKRAQLQRRSHHPVLEGLMACSNCHNPHGSVTDSLLVQNNVVETCTQCHAEKRGPFLWEHQPVSEDCTVCHNPHGSTQDRLLALRMPFLCQGCHQDVFHPSTLYSGDDVPPLGAAQQLLGKSCTNCHAQVHGSNHPSGSRLTR